MQQQMRFKYIILNNIQHAQEGDHASDQAWRTSMLRVYGLLLYPVFGEHYRHGFSVILGPYIYIYI